MLSIFNWFGYKELTPAESFRLIKQAGFEGVLLWWDDDFLGPAYRLQPELARREGLYVENIHPNDKNATAIWKDTQKGQAVYEYYLRCVDDCAAFEIPTVVLHPAQTNPVPPPPNARALDRFKRIVDRAEQIGVNVAVENMRGAQAIARVAWVLEQIDSPRLGLCFDNGMHHARLLHTPEAELLARLGHRLMSLHLSDNHGMRGEHLLPFDGTVDWPAQMKAIAETGYRGPTTLEAENGGYQDKPPAEFLALAYERAVQLEALR